jgi:hypothetical protein
MEMVLVKLRFEESRGERLPTITGDAVSCSGATLADATPTGTGDAGATGESVTGLTFSVSGPVSYTIDSGSSGWLLIQRNDEFGANLVFESINTQGFSTPYHTEGSLEPAEYTIRFRHCSAAYHEQPGNSVNQGTFTASFALTAVTMPTDETSFGEFKSFFGEEAP